MNAITKNEPRLPLAELSRIADNAASKFTFQDYKSRKAKRTIARQDAELERFELFLYNQGHAADVGNLRDDPLSWQYITYGFVMAFVEWAKQEGYALSTINLHISTIKTYAKLAVRAGAMTVEQFVPIQLIQGYGYSEAMRVDTTRTQTRHSTSTKKSKSNIVARESIERMKTPVDGTIQAVRDALLMAILFDHGFRVGEVALFTFEMIDSESDTLTFYRPKVKKTQTHALSPDVLRLLHIYQSFGVVRSGPLFISTRKDKTQDHIGMTDQAIIQRVRFLGKNYGIPNLSPHDCRHTWATYAAQAGTPLDALQHAGGWNSPAMPMRYIEAARIANERVILGNKPEKKKRK